jgi:hypothetical protein
MPERASSLVWMALMLGGCGIVDEGSRPGSDCKYTDVSGTALIVSISTAPSGSYNCPREAVEVRFDFRPDDPKATSKNPNWPDAGQSLRVGAGMNPPRVWVADRGIAVGREYRAVRRDETAGACTPVVFELTGLDTSGWEKECW